MITLEDFHQDFTQSVLSEAESRGLMKSQAFFEIVCEDLNSIGDLTKDYTYAEYIKKGIESYGYDFDEERKILTLLNHHYFQDDVVQTLTRSQIDTKFSRTKALFTKSIQGLYQQMEETSEAHTMAYNILRYYEKGLIDKVRLVLITDGKATRSLTELPSEVVNKLQVEFLVVDIEYLFKIYTSQSDQGEFEVEVDLPYLQANDSDHAYVSYLAVIPGKTLVNIYEKFGQKLFEQNVRTFLQFRGGVNKGLKNTIENRPEMFFAYNNGITATASNITFNSNGNIGKIHNFQIVNGGQTTSAIYAADKTSKLDVSKVAVQMKLSVVKDQSGQDDFVSKVAEYANTQNKINNSDFFSNSPFHKDMKQYSQKVFAPASGGSQRRTHWYYERVRGEYLNSQAYLTADGKRKFALENPKEQLVDKTLLSKSENAWGQKPHIVSKGAQDSFKHFADRTTEQLEKDNLSITESYFKDAMSRVILFRTTEKIITNSAWYDGGFRAQTVAYSVAYLSAVVQNTGVHLNFGLIWEAQALPNAMIKMLEAITQEVYSAITNPAAGYANITQWTKNAGCWEKVKELDIDFEALDEFLFITKQEQQYMKKEERESKALDASINMQVEVVKIKASNWPRLYDYYSKDKSTLRLSSMHLDILKKMSYGSMPVPSEKQSAVLYKALHTAIAEGFALLE